MSALRDARLNAGLTIVEAAKEIGIPQGYLSEIENGKRHVSPERAEAIAKVYKKSKDEIFLPSRYAIREVNANHTA
ncbi:Helix-turn-helix [Cohnella sp. OV330]|uniref:helix-turn-helix domain-containing protein n=1 Tax=Cohnella sp. OV330 TaxID=1855288 RepID=UPI0008EF713E|nr:helix-turn-helix transcriptional regulator [Cohnella sp. OV330]SFB62738.1 Helix-turn-helix [Cohnella sp. OV330]